MLARVIILFKKKKKQIQKNNVAKTRDDCRFGEESCSHLSFDNMAPMEDEVRKKSNNNDDKFPSISHLFLPNPGSSHTECGP